MSKFKVKYAENSTAYSASCVELRVSSILNCRIIIIIILFV